MARSIALRIRVEGLVWTEFSLLPNPNRNRL